MLFLFVCLVSWFLDFALVNFSYLVESATFPSGLWYVIFRLQ